MTDEEAEHAAWRQHCDNLDRGAPGSRHSFNEGFHAGLAHERARQAELLKSVCELPTRWIMSSAVLAREAAAGVAIRQSIESKCARAETLESCAGQLQRMLEPLAALDHPTPIEPDPAPEIPQHPGPNLTEEDVRRLAREVLAECAKDARDIDRVDYERSNHNDWDRGFWCASSRALGTLAEAASAEPKGGRDE